MACDPMVTALAIRYWKVPAIFINYLDVIIYEFFINWCYLKQKCIGRYLLFSMPGIGRFYCFTMRKLKTATELSNFKNKYLRIFLL